LLRRRGGGGRRGDGGVGRCLQARRLRKDDTRRKILVGAIVLAKVARRAPFGQNAPHRFSAWRRI
jgi:hypothetical protein